MDGVGEWHTATIGRGKGNSIELLKALNFPHSLGLLYSAFTYFCGFKVNSAEYKLMGLAPYGEPKYADLIRDKLMDLKEDGSFRMDMRYFNYCRGWTMTNRRFEKLFGGPPRRSDGLLTQREMDMAASIQLVTEEIVLRMARTARDLTGARKLCLGGGVFVFELGSAARISASCVLLSARSSASGRRPIFLSVSPPAGCCGARNPPKFAAWRHTNRSSVLVWAQRYGLAWVTAMGRSDRAMASRVERFPECDMSMTMPRRCCWWKT